MTAPSIIEEMEIVRQYEECRSLLREHNMEVKFRHGDGRFAVKCRAGGDLCACASIAQLRETCRLVAKLCDAQGVLKQHILGYAEELVSEEASCGNGVEPNVEFVRGVCELAAQCDSDRRGLPEGLEELKVRTQDIARTFGVEFELYS